MNDIAKFAVSYTRRYGLKIVPLPPGQKRPLANNWGDNVISDWTQANDYFQRFPDSNIGIALGPSGLCSLDIDDLEAMQIICDEFGIDLKELRENTPTIQGKPGKFRCMFRVPAGVSLQYHSLFWPRRDGSGKTFTVFELRAACDGQARQDVFPPSIHPDTGEPYQWLTRPEGKFPEPPQWLLALWQQWDKFKPQIQEMCPWAPKPERKVLPMPPSPRQGASVIEAYNAGHRIDDALERYGYVRKGRRYLSPSSDTKLAGVVVFDDNRCWIHHGSDALCSDASGKPVGPFDLFCHYEHGGDVKRAVRAAGEAMGMPAPTPAPQWTPDMPVFDPQTGEILETIPVPTLIDWETLGLACTEGKNPKPHSNLDNVVRVIENHPDLKRRIWYDEFLDAIVTDWQGPERQWKDADDIKLQLFMQRYIGLTKVNVGTCHDAAVAAAFHDVRNECRAWIEAQRWDGVERIERLIPDGFGAEDTAYTRAVGRCWMISMVARVFSPGCKVDTVPVLEGDQGKGKSSALAALGGKWFTECHESVTTKDFYGVLQGHMLVEISEMHSFTRAEVERIKGIISCQSDRFRKAYGRNTEDHPRQTVLACTTNRYDWQRDDTGARRFWPVRCGTLDLEWIREHRAQLFAEALSAFQNGAVWWDIPADEQAEQVSQRREIDVWEHVVLDWMEINAPARVDEVLLQALRIEVPKQDNLAARRVRAILTQAGYVTKSVRIGSQVTRAWSK